MIEQLPQASSGFISVKMSGELRHEDVNNMLPLIEVTVAICGIERAVT